MQKMSFMTYSKNQTVLLKYNHAAEPGCQEYFNAFFINFAIRITILFQNSINDSDIFSIDQPTTTFKRQMYLLDLDLKQGNYKNNH